MVQDTDTEAIQRRIVELQVEHRDLDQIIDMLTAQPGFDQLQVRRLKKRKLQIKDSITLLQIQLEPDIPA
ncbi:MAG: YdcH family protein [Limnobacter sp.]|uniref:YdcH family protein n=1 Tax=Limnobacter sp. TaxID=2003368 RepID=UPI00391DDA90